MALVVSIVEEGNHGVMVLRKAGKIIKGNEMKGFILNIVFNLLALIIYLGTQIIIKKWTFYKNNSMLILVNGSCLLKVFELVNYTVLYFHFKKEKGEEEIIELQESIEYSNIYDLPLIIGERKWFWTVGYCGETQKKNVTGYLHMKWCPKENDSQQRGPERLFNIRDTGRSESMLKSTAGIEPDN
ncbi:hypothetical protein H5410_035647 [Solanum commersonii]|uniref:Uncharacterized protein n=1 Tax=Solanum commersonii TaxID=4109 RepID=A0A9J5Y3G1_SOLCO|nr:hypothetical protein H5410_035647 [Solanum commersonii]